LAAWRRWLRVFISDAEQCAAIPVLKNLSQSMWLTGYRNPHRRGYGVVVFVRACLQCGRLDGRRTYCHCGAPLGQNGWFGNQSCDRCGYEPYGHYERIAGRLTRVNRPCRCEADAAIPILAILVPQLFGPFVTSTIRVFIGPPRSHRFAITLEHTLFPPGTPRNQDYNVGLVAWPLTDPHHWSISIWPIVELPAAKRIATETGMRVANGVPMIGDIGKSRIIGTIRNAADFLPVIHHQTRLPIDRVWRFPLDHARVYTLENDKHSPVYLHRGEDFIRAEERRWLDEFDRTGRVR
jgi:hypothetical protein